MNISMIVATDLYGCIGLKGNLPWHISEDLKKFKKITTNNIVVMGRKTFESCGYLDNRTNIVLTSKKIDNIICVDNIGGVLTKLDKVKENFIIGGGQIYELFLPYINKLYLTKVQTAVRGNTFIPTINWEDWSLTKYKESSDSNYSYVFYEYIKK